MRDGASWTLQRIGAAAVPGMLPLLKDSDRDVRREAARALAWVRPASPEVVNGLAETLRRAVQTVQAAVLGCPLTLPGTQHRFHRGAELDDRVLREWPPRLFCEGAQARVGKRLQVANVEFIGGRHTSRSHGLRLRQLERVA